MTGNDASETATSGRAATPDVSVVVPCFNVADVVERAVRSALDQSLPPVQILCVDDGSTDDTLAVLHRLRDEAPDRVEVLTGPNAGAPAARNKGLAKAAGTYVQFLDADDALDATKLEAQVEILAGEEHPPDLLVGASRRRLLSGDVEDKPLGDANPWLAFIERRLGITTANLWRRESVLAVGEWNEAWRSSQEAELMFRMLQQGARVVYDPVPRATIYEREGSITHDPQFDHRERHVRLRVEALEHLRREGTLDPEEMDRATRLVFALIRSLSPLGLGKAAEFHDRVIPRTFTPPPSATSADLYVIAYRTMGFRSAEALSLGAGCVRSVLQSVVPGRA